MDDTEELTIDLDKILFKLQDVRDTVVGVGSHELLEKAIQEIDDAARSLIAFHQVMNE
jgi:hypothetical protein